MAMKRTQYTMTHQNIGQGQIGRLFTLMAEEVAPGDTWSGRTGLLIRFSPLKRALLNDFYVDQFMFYVPHRLVFADWENFIAEGPRITPTYPLPTISIGNTGATDIDHLWYNSTGILDTEYSALRLYAYNLCWNEYFRDEDQGVTAPSTGGRFGRPANFKKDYWTNLRAGCRVQGKSCA